MEQHIDWMVESFRIVLERLEDFAEFWTMTIEATEARLKDWIFELGYTDGELISFMEA